MGGSMADVELSVGSVEAAQVAHPPLANARVGRARIMHAPRGRRPGVGDSRPDVLPGTYF